MLAACGRTLAGSERWNQCPTTGGNISYVEQGREAVPESTETATTAPGVGAGSTSVPEDDEIGTQALEKELENSSDLVDLQEQFGS